MPATVPDSPGRRRAMSLTDSIQQDRHIIVAVDTARNTVRIKGVADACTDLSCSAQTLAVSDEGRRAARTALNARDNVRLEGTVGRPACDVVVRRVGDALSSPAWCSGGSATP